MSTEKREIYRIYTNNGEVLVPRSVVINSLKEIYRLTEENDIDVALDTMRTLYRKNEELMALTNFVSKLLQLDASGRVQPPINFGPTYDLAIEEVEKEARTLTQSKSYFNLKENAHYVEQVLGRQILFDLSKIGNKPSLGRQILFDLSKIGNKPSNDKFFSIKR